MDPLARRCLFILALLLLSGGAGVAVASALPDLTVQTFEPPSGTVERTFAISSAVRNIGTSPSGVFTVWFVLSSDTMLTLKDTQIGTREIRSLNPGATSQELSVNVTVPGTVPPGSYYLFMVVDPANEIAESDETNNLRFDPDPVRILADQPPDIGSWTFFTYPGPVARTFTVDAEVRNYGTGPTGPFTVGLYLSIDTTFTTADVLVDESHVDDLAAGATASVYRFITVPASVPAGPYYLGMIMDTQNAVAEINEANNVAYRPDQVVISDLPDLAVEDWMPPSGPVDRTFSVGSSVKNYGVTPAGPFTAGFYLSGDTTFTTADTLVGTRSCGGLGAGAGTPLENTTLTVPDSFPAGTYYLGMIVDPANTVVEAEEGNNVAFTKAPVTLAGLPDIAEWTFAPPSGSQPRTFTIYNADTNIGTAPTGPFTVGFYLSADTAFTTNDTLIGTRLYADLAAGAAGPNEHTVVTIPGSVPAGSYYLGKIMDPANEVAESNENNNVFFDLDPITISAAPAPDIGASNFLVGGTGLFKRYDFRGEARNLGTTQTGPFAVAYYLSVDSTFTMGDTLLGVANIADLVPGATADLHRFYDVPASIPAGSYYLGVILDPTNAVAESNETNNVAFDPDPVVISNLPDMAPLSIGIPGGTAARTFVITSRFRNDGMTAAGPFAVEFYLSADTRITSADSLIGTRFHDALAAGTTGPYGCTTATVPASVPGGQYYLGGIIDPANAVNEAIENNNAFYLVTPITVPPALAPVPPSTLVPTDMNSDTLYDDVNGNGRADFADVVLYFNAMAWIAANEPVAAFDCNRNGRIDFADVVWLFNNL